MKNLRSEMKDNLLSTAITLANVQALVSIPQAQVPPSPPPQVLYGVRRGPQWSV
jgi:hypothetical protein